MLAREDLRKVLRLLRVRAVEHEGRTELDLAEINDAGCADAFKLLGIDHLLREAQPQAAVDFRPGWRAPASGVEQVDPFPDLVASQPSKRTKGVLSPGCGIMLFKPVTEALAEGFVGCRRRVFSHRCRLPWRETVV